MMRFDRFALLFNSICSFRHLFIFILSARDMEKVGIHYAEYFALIFFILCGIILVSSFNSLLILFLASRSFQFHLYILTGSDKRNLKSNEASLKYFLMGAFSTGLDADGYCPDLWRYRHVLIQSKCHLAADKPVRYC